MATSTDILQPVQERGWQSGFKNLLWKENNLRWGGRRWIVPAIVWLALLNGFVLMIALAAKLDPSMSGQDIASMAVSIFVSMGIFASSIGIVVGAQGAIIREKELGTAAWVLSKPASRTAFVLSKWLAHSISSLILSLVLPAAVFLAQSQIFWARIPALVPFLAACLIMVLHLQFYLVLALMLGTLFQTRGVVTGVSLGFLLLGSLLTTVLPPWISMLTPWSLQELANVVAVGGPLPGGWQVQVSVTALWIPIFIGVALWRFGREEF